MKTLAPKSTNDQLLADDWNKVPADELQNAVTDQGITLNPSDDHQLTKSTANAVSIANSFIDSGSANVYNLSPVAPRKAPTLYISGMVVRFLPLNSNTGVPATVNLNSLGAKSIKDQNGHDPAANTIAKGHEVELRYDGVNFILTQAKKQLNYLPLIKTISGLELNNGTDTDHDIDIAAGTFIDTTNFNAFRNVSTFTKEIDATFALGSGNGGMASGVALAINTWYHVHALANPITGAVDFGFDTSVTATNLLADGVVSAAGFTLYRRIGSVQTDGSSNISPFYMIVLTNSERRVRWKDPINVYRGERSFTPTNDTPTLFTIAVPPDINIIANIKFFIEIFGATSGGGVPIRASIYSPLRNDPVVPFINDNEIFAFAVGQGVPNVGNGTQGTTYEEETDTSRQLKYIANATLTGGLSYALNILTKGWIE